MTKDELLKQIRNTLANPQSWVDAGLGHNVVKNAEAWVDERARNLAAWVLPMIPREVEGWENEETWVVWMRIVNNRSLFGRVESMTDPMQVRREFMDVYGFAHGNDFAADVVRVWVDRVDWRGLTDELRRQKVGA